MAKAEDRIYLQLARYLSTQYKGLIFHFDTGTGMKMTIGQARKQKGMNPKRGYPDLFIAEPKGEYAGMYVEIKVDSPFKKDGGLKAGEHLKEQFDMLLELNNKGYYALFGAGFDECKRMIDMYLNLK